MIYFPGTVIVKNGLTGKQFLDGMFVGTGGLVMSQIREMTGLNAPAIQNWANRGWISRPQGKRYTEDQVARILIINMLRETMQLESVAKLLYYVNGVAGKESDDIISESELYGYISDIMFDATDDAADEVIKRVTAGFAERRPGDLSRLVRALKAVYFSLEASRYMEKASVALSELIGMGAPKDLETDKV